MTTGLGAGLGLTWRMTTGRGAGLGLTYFSVRFCSLRMKTVGFSSQGPQTLSGSKPVSLLANTSIDSTRIATVFG